MFNFFKKSEPPKKEPTLCIGKVMANSLPEELREHYRFMLQASKERLRFYIESKVIAGKYWVAGRTEVCAVCKENEQAGIIPLDALFPSGHLYPPAGELCRCVLGGKTDENA